MTRMFVAPFLTVAVAAGLVTLSAPAIAQPPGKGFGKDFGKKDGPDRGGQGDAVRTLESELAKLKALEADLEAKLKQLKGPAPKHDAPHGAGGLVRPGGFGPPGPGGFGPPGSFGGRGPGGPGEHARGHEPKGGPHHRMSGAVQGVVRAASNLSPQQLKEVISALEHLQAQKHRAEAPAPRSADRPSFRPEGRPEARPAGRSGASSNDQILERLDRLARELDEIRRAVRK